MKSDDLSSGIDRRVLVSSLVALPALSTALLPSPVRAQTTPSAPLASWNEGPAKQAIVDFVRASTDQRSSKFVLPRTGSRLSTRMARSGSSIRCTRQVVYCLDRVPGCSGRSRN